MTGHQIEQAGVTAIEGKGVYITFEDSDTAFRVANEISLEQEEDRLTKAYREAVKS